MVSSLTNSHIIALVVLSFILYIYILILFKMGVFAGLIVLKPLTNQRRYEYVLGEIRQYLKVHESEISI